MGMFGLLAVLLLSLFAVSAVALDAPTWVKVDGDELDTNKVNDVDRGDELEVRIAMEPKADVKDARLEVEIEGYEYDEIRAVSDIFDMEAGKVYKEELTLELPDDMDKEEYTLRVTLSDRTSEVEDTYTISIGSARHALTIEDVVFSPENNVKAGRSLLATVRVENTGDKDQDGVKVRVAIDELGIAASDFIDEIKADDAKTSEELYMRVPECAVAKDYEAKITVEFNGDETEKETRTITVSEGDLCGSDAKKSSVVMGPTTQDVEAGEAVVFPLTISNGGKAAQTYTVGVAGADFADVQVAPSNVVVLNPGESQAVYVTVAPKKGASEGAHMFTLTVDAGSEQIKDAVLTANVTAGSGDWVKGLEIGLIVLVVVLIILGLIIGFNKMKGSEDEGDETGGQTYY